MSVSWALFQLHIQLFFLKQVLRRQAACGSSSQNEVHEMTGRKNNCMLNFFSMCFVWNNEEIDFSFKNRENSRHKL